MRLYLARHGQTDWNAQHRVQGITDIPLNKIGVVQAEELRNKVRKIDFDACYASPLIRAQKTAEIATEGKYRILLDDRLRERGFGKLEGKVCEDWADIAGGIDIFDRKLNFAGMGIEPVNTMQARAEDFLDDLREKYPFDAKVLVVAHAGLLRDLHFAIVGYDDDTDFATFKIDNAELKEYCI